jgi:hypothetical protein
MLRERNCGRAGEAPAVAALAVAADERGEKGELLGAAAAEADDEERGDSIVAVAVAERMCDEDDDDAEEDEERSGVEEAAEAAAGGATSGVVPKERLPRTKLSRPSASVFSSVFSRKLSKLASCAEDAEARTEADAAEDEDEVGATALWPLLLPPARSRATPADDGRLLPLRLPFERDMAATAGAAQQRTKHARMRLENVWCTYQKYK